MALQDVVYANIVVFGFISALVLWVCYVGYHVIYNIYFHPLSSYPGPKISAATRIPYFNALLRGHQHSQFHKLHEDYGEVVRVAPDELSFITGGGWKDIYAQRPGLPEVPKDKAWYTTPVGFEAASILEAEQDLHSHLRRLFSPAFSDKAIRDQEPMIQKYTNMLIQGLHEKATGGEPHINLVEWYHWTLFDMIGDFSFGESFDCLKDSTYHPWVELVLNAFKVVPFLNFCGRYPAAGKLLMYCAPKDMMAKRDFHVKLTSQKVNRRLERMTDRIDAMSYILKDLENKELTITDIETNASLFIMAGSETTATALSGTTYLLLRNPRVMRKLVEEIRSTFATENDITIVNVNRLTYLPAVFQEAMRLYPPIPNGLPRRVVGQGTVINGRWVPPNTSVSVAHFAAYHSPSNFTEPESFIPERFLGDSRFANDEKTIHQPFSVGPRNCIGQNLAKAEMRVVMARVLWNFDIELAPGSEKWICQKSHTGWDVGPMFVKLTAVARG